MPYFPPNSGGGVPSIGGITGAVGLGGTLSAVGDDVVGIVAATYPVFPGGPFATIQDAIDQASTDGHNTIETSCIILISPNPDGWGDPINLIAGCHLQGWGGNSIYPIDVNGPVTFAPLHDDPFGQQLTISGLNFSASPGESCVSMTGSLSGQLTFIACNFYDGNPDGDPACISMTNSGGASLIQLTDVNIDMQNDVIAIDAQGSVSLTRGNINSSSGIGLNATAFCGVVDTGFDTYGVAIVVNGTSVVVSNSATISSNAVDTCQITDGTIEGLGAYFANGNADGNIFNLSSGNVAMGNGFVSLSSADGYVAYGTGNFEYANLAFVGSNTNVQNTVTLVALSTTPTVVP